jgi:EAL domain-containing protein (putative c-di-GMP-specific phosphodiesterase class I)
MIILEGTDRPESAGQVGDKILAALARPFLLMNRKLYITGSIGIVVYPLDGDSIEGLLRDADLAMYSAKDAGKNNYQFFTAELRARTSERLHMLDSLRAALQTDNELWLAYQPRVSLDGGRIVGVEALARWNHPELGLVPPGRFIPIAEDTDLILPFGRWVLREACHQAREWQDAGLESLGVSINVAARQFRHGDLVETVESAIRESGVDPTRIELELTEGTLIEDTEIARRTLERLKTMGVQISIDDFGTGYSSLAYLREFPIDYLKIDRSFVSDLGGGPDEAAIATAVISLGHSLGLAVVAEGVETTEQLAVLTDLGCDFAQGYLFGRPVPAPEIEPFVRAGVPLAV